MATSGTYTFDLEVHEIIEEAFELVGGEHTSGKSAQDARRALNLVLRDLETRGVPLGSLTQKSQTVTDGTSSYTLDSEVLDIIDMVVRRDDTDTTLKRVSLSDFNTIADKTQEGRPTTFTLDRQKSAVILHLWPTPENSTDTLYFWTFNKIEDVTKAAQNLDIHQRFLPALVYGLAYNLALKRGPEGEAGVIKRQELKREYESHLDRALREDRERVSFIATPTIKGGYRR